MHTVNPEYRLVIPFIPFCTGIRVVLIASINTAKSANK